MMKDTNEESLVEKITSSKSLGLTTTTISALCTSVTPLAAFVPFLVDCIAKDRHKKRIEKILQEINLELARHSKEINEISDAKYKIISESIAEIFKTINEEKLTFLKRAIANSITSEFISDLNTDLLSRIIRDISPHEVIFILNNSSCKNIYLADGESTQDYLYVKPNSSEEIIFNGLVNLGLIHSPNLEMNDNTRYQYSAIVQDVVKLFNDKKN